MRRRYRIPTGAGFGYTSPREQREADLFARDLLGQPPRFERAEAEWPGPRDGGPEDVAGGLDLVEFVPEDLALDMTGLEFVLASAGNVGTPGGPIWHPPGTVVTVVKWDNAKTEIDGKVAGASVTVGKELLAPKLSRYRAKVTTTKRTYESEVPLYAANVKALRDLVVSGKAAGKDQTANYKQLNKHLIVELQLNRLDSLLGRWTSWYDLLIGEKATPKEWPPLAPGWVKSILVQESTAGTAGKHLDETAGNPLKNRFNVLQAIDSWGFQQFLMMEELEPGLLKREGLDKVIDDQRALEKEWESLFAKAAPTTAEKERLEYLDELKYARPATRESATWSTFFSRYPDVVLKPGRSSGSAGRSPGTTGTRPDTGTGTSTTGGGSPGARRKYWDVVKEFLERGTPKRKYDYSFWVRTGVRWLFEKRKEFGTWSDAVRAYNGTGGRAEFYRAIVLTRARAAAAAAGIKEPIWGGFDCPPDRKTADGVFQLCPFERIANPCEPRC